MINEPLTISSDNLSLAWGQAFLHIVKHAGKPLAPLLISIGCADNSDCREDAVIRQTLDACLENSGEQNVQSVANTIFPMAYWKLAKGDRQRLYKMYKDNFPRIKALAKAKNHRGLYFERLITFGPSAYDGNQLEYIIQEFNARNGVRTSMFQAAIFDAKRDHIRTAQLGFPCLQHISLVPDRKKRQLALNAFYATQQIFQKAYGNYLGLCRLGSFMAGEMGLTFARLNCFVGVEKFDERSKYKSVIGSLTNVVEESLHQAVFYNTEQNQHGTTQQAR